jgi:hypothetical protein
MSPNPAPIEIAAILPVSRKEMSGAAPIAPNAWFKGEFEAVPVLLPVAVPVRVSDAVPEPVLVCVPDVEEVGLGVGVEESDPLLELVTDGLAPIEREAVGVQVDEPVRLEVELGVPDVVDVPVGDDVAVPETLFVPVPVEVIDNGPTSEIVELALAPRVMDAVGVRVDDDKRLIVVLGVFDDVTDALIVEEEDDTIDFKLL